MHQQTISKNGEKKKYVGCLLSMFRCRASLLVCPSMGKKPPFELAAAFFDVRRKQRLLALIREACIYCYFFLKNEPLTASRVVMSQ